MDMALVANQAATLCFSACSRGSWQNKIVSNIPLTQTRGLTKPLRDADRFSATYTSFLNQTNSGKAFSSVSAAAESELELTDVELEEVTPLEAFFNRYNSFFETWDRKKLRRIISAGSLNRDDPSPSILVLLGSEAFVRELCDECPNGYVETYHFSLNVLSDIKEHHDETRCFHIVTTDFSEISGSFDAIFLNYFPAFSKSLPKLLKDATRFCKPGGTVVISLANDKRNLSSLKVESGGLIQSELPNEDNLIKIISSLPLELVSLEDLPNLYVASLKMSQSRRERKTK